MDSNSNKIKKIINKKNIIYLIIFIIIALIGICLWSYFNSENEVINNIDVITPGEEISDEQMRYTSIKLYFINKENGKIEKEAIRADSKILLSNPCNEILNLWLIGPHNKKLTTGLTDGVKINKININQNCAEIDFNEKFIEYNGENSVDELKIIYCIVNSLTELNEINSVSILINGQENVYVGNVNLSEKFLRLNENE